MLMFSGLWNIGIPPVETEAQISIYIKTIINQQKHINYNIQSRLLTSYLLAIDASWTRGTRSASINSASKVKLKSPKWNITRKVFPKIQQRHRKASTRCIADLTYQQRLWTSPKWNAIYSYEFAHQLGGRFVAKETLKQTAFEQIFLFKINVYSNCTKYNNSSLPLRVAAFCLVLSRALAIDELLKLQVSGAICR